MSKIVELKIGREGFDQRRMKLLENKGVIGSADLKKCLGITLDHEDAFENLVHILTSYCLIYELNTDSKRLLQLQVGEKLFLVPCVLPESKSIAFPPKCYQFQFEFESYLPEEVYLHVLCQFLEWITEDTKEIVLTSTCSIFTHTALERQNKYMADWKIEMNKENHRLIVSV